MFYSFLVKSIEYLKIREDKKKAVSVAARFRESMAEAALVSHSWPQHMTLPPHAVAAQHT